MLRPDPVGARRYQATALETIGSGAVGIYINIYIYIYICAEGVVCLEVLGSVLSVMLLDEFCTGNVFF